DNNITERDIRPFTTGRKNWLFSKSVNGAQASATLYSIVMTCLIALLKIFANLVKKLRA
ncbi:transposase, partial [Colwellia sp. BRX8-8]|nr:transposase [Colwellia sp. BRX8-8]